MGNIGLSEILVILIIAAFTILPIYLTYKKAKEKNRSILFWIIAAVFFGWLAYIAISILGKNK